MSRVVPVVIISILCHLYHFLELAGFHKTLKIHAVGGYRHAEVFKFKL